MSDRADDIQLLGAKVRVRRKGSGPPLLFLHGAGGVPVWLPFFDRLAENFEVIVPDHPGFGESDTPPWLRNMGDMAYFYLDLIEALRLRGASVVGSSLGAWIAAEAAVRDPRAFGRIVLMAPAGLRVRGAEAGDVFIWNREELLKNLFFDPRLSEQMIRAPMAPEALELQLKNTYTTARLAWEPRFFNPDLKRWLHRIVSPVQIVWGANDKIFPPSFVEPWLQELPNAVSLVIGECGHLPHVEKSDESARAILPFLMVSTS